MPKTQITTTINNETVEFLCEPRQSLLDVLRDTLRLTGAKEGCNNGNCGACNVILNDSLVNACCVLGVEANGATITTIEGVAQGESLHPLQSAFIAEQAMQCGYCVSGILVSAAALLARNPDPAEAEVRAALDRNLCRCGAHNRMVRAVLRAAKAGQPA